MYKKVISTLQNFLAPAFCYRCRIFLSSSDPLCANCYNLIKPIVSTELVLTGSHSIRVHAVSAYTDPLQQLVLAKNYNGIYASRYLGDIIANRIPLNTIKGDYLVPVPLHWTRYAWRGFNHAHVIAETIAKHTSVQVFSCVKRVRKTRFQAELNAQERTTNIRESFELTCKPELIKDKHIIIIDDLMTTGSTIRALGKLFLSASPASIQAIVACRTVS